MCIVGKWFDSRLFRVCNFMFRRTIYNPCESFLDITDHWSNQKSVVFDSICFPNPFSSHSWEFFFVQNNQNFKKNSSVTWKTGLDGWKVLKIINGKNSSVLQDKSLQHLTRSQTHFHLYCSAQKSPQTRLTSNNEKEFLNYSDYPADYARFDNAKFLSLFEFRMSKQFP